MSQPRTLNNYTDDELFMGEGSSFRVEKSSNGSLYSGSFMQQSAKSSSNSNVLAYYMLKSLLLRLSFLRAKSLKLKKFRALTKWRYPPSSEFTYNLSEKTLNSMVANLNSARKILIQKYFLSWKITSVLISTKSKFSSRKGRREEAHSAQVVQINRVLNQMQVKKTETEKFLDTTNEREKKLKETVDGLQKTLGNSIEIAKYHEIFKKLQIENENLKDRLEAVQNNVGIFIKEMNTVLVPEDEVYSDDDGVEDSHFKTMRKKKSSMIRYN